MPQKADTQSRKWQLTINNPMEKEPALDHDKIKLILSQLKSVTYFCLSDEVGTEKTPHSHIFIYCKSPVHFSRLKKLFPAAHIEQAYGTVAENRDYVAKTGKWADDPKADTRIDGTFEEWGVLPSEPGQGARTDIAAVYEMIADGMSNAEIMAANPDYASQINRMDAIRQNILEEKFRNIFRKLTVTYIFGPTETGKTRGVMERHGYGNVYRVTDYNHPFDRYAQEPTLVFEEFRSSLPIGDMLNYLDGYPLSLPARYANRVACFETVYIVSNIDLKQQYFNVQDNEPATWKAFLRRIHHVIEYHADGTTTDHGSATDYIFPPPPPVPDWVREIENAEQGEIEQLPY